MLFFIIGYMGAGKSVFGSQLAEKLGYSFHDLDDLIEQEAGVTIPEIFENSGEEEFRKLEQKVLLDHLDDQDTVIATGGGAPCFYDNMELMNKRGITVFLDVPVETIIRRLLAETTNRPLMQQIPQTKLPDYIREHIEKRKVFYSRALIRFESNNIDFLIDIIRRMSLKI